MIKGLAEGADSERKRVDELQARVDRVERKSRFEATSVMCKAYPLLPWLFDGQAGVVTWCPVIHTDQHGQKVRLILLSIPMTKFIMELIDSELRDMQLASFLDDAFKQYKDGSPMSTDEFDGLIMKTPFKKYKTPVAKYKGGGEGPPPATIKKANVEKYRIMTWEYWKALMEEIARAFPDHPRVLPTTVKKANIPKAMMAQDWAMRSEDDAAFGPTVEIPELGRALSFEERLTCPSSGSSWCREWYELGAAEYFGMDTGPDMKHVLSGVYHHDQGGVVKSFKDVLRSVRVLSSGASPTSPKGKGKGKGKAVENGSSAGAGSSSGAASRTHKKSQDERRRKRSRSEDKDKKKHKKRSKKKPSSQPETN